MTKDGFKLVGIIAGTILVLGFLFVAAQYFAQGSTGANASVNENDLPPQMTISREDYVAALGLLSQYDQVTDLARKNKAVAELRQLVEGWAKQ